MSAAIRPAGPGRRFARSLLSLGLSVAALVLAILWGVDAASLLPIPSAAVVPSAARLFATMVPLLPLWVGFLAGSALSVVPHELAHFAAAKSLGLPVLGVAIGRMTFGGTSPRTGALGHVHVDVRRAGRTALPIRMAVFALAGPAGGLAFAGLAALAAADGTLPMPVRLLSGGVVASVVAVQLFNLVPGTSRGGDPNDGALAIRWGLRAGHQLELVELAREVQAYALEVSPSATGDTDLSEEMFERVRVGLADPRPEIAVVAAHRLLVWLFGAIELPSEERERARSEFARRARVIAPELVGFASRPEPAVDLRLSALRLLTHVLIRQYLRDSAGRPADPESPEVLQIARAAEVEWRLRPEAQLTRNHLGLARLLQHRPAEARTLLLHSADLDPAADEGVLSDAEAIRGLAECYLGDVAQARRLLDASRRRTRQSDYAGWLEAAIRARRERESVPEPAAVDA